jgi:hypothetical protein
VFQSFLGQTFIGVLPVDHLGTAIPDLPPVVVPEPPAPLPPSIDPSAILAALAHVEAALVALEGRVDIQAIRVAALTAKVPPTYVGRLGPMTIVLHPDVPR